MTLRTKRAWKKADNRAVYPNAWPSRFRGPSAAHHSLKMGDEYGGFALLNLLDLCLTALIFHHGGREVNPIGYQVMLRYGLSGYTLFKFGLVAIVCLACEKVHTAQPRTAMRMMNAANLVYLGIVLWECVLIGFR
jgi:hypothetical protein